MLSNILIGLIVVLITITIHSGVTVLVRELVSDKYHFDSSKLRRLLYIDLIVLIIILATIFESLVWGYTFYYLGSLDKLGDALYFSLVTYTTLGYGDVILAGEYRLLAAVEAANGVIMLGWSTALVVGFIQKVYFAR